jgi:hypothetical protein
MDKVEGIEGSENLAAHPLGFFLNLRIHQIFQQMFETEPKYCARIRFGVFNVKYR